MTSVSWDVNIYAIAISVASHRTAAPYYYARTANETDVSLVVYMYEWYRILVYNSVFNASRAVCTAALCDDDMHDFSPISDYSRPGTNL
jgi:hypothetical protein